MLFTEALLLPIATVWAGFCPTLLSMVCCWRQVWSVVARRRALFVRELQHGPRAPGSRGQRGLHSFRHLLLVQGARVEAVVECTNPCTVFMRAGCDVAGSAGAARVRLLFGCSTYANDRAAFKGLVPTCPALAPEVDRLDGTLLLRRSQQRVERRSRAIWYCPIAGERAR